MNQIDNHTDEICFIETFREAAWSKSWVGVLTQSWGEGSKPLEGERVEK